MNSYVFLQLHREYYLSDYSFKKLLQQYCNLFKVKRKIERLVYESKLSSHWKIHSVISVTQLKLASTLEIDSFNRLFLNYSKSIPESDDTEEWILYEIKELINRRYKKYDKERHIKKYLVWWKSYKTEFDEWYCKR